MSDNQKIVKNLFYYVEKHLFGADSDSGNDLLTRGQFGVMMTPGQFLNPNWNENTGSNDMYLQAEFLDEALDTSFTYRPLTSTVSGQYWDALDKVSLRHRPLTAKEKAELRDIESEIAALQPKYDLYASRYDDAAEAYEGELSKQNPNQATLARLLRAMNSARNNWETLGRKSYFDNNLIGRAWQLQTGNPSGEWIKLRNTFQNATKIAPVGQYQTTLLNPSISTWNTSAGWASFARTVTDTETHSYSSSTSWSGGMGARWGLFNSVSVGANGSKTVNHEVSDVTTINVSFDYLRCRIVRPWLKSDLFANRDWTWIQPNMFRYLSDGGNLFTKPSVRPIGTLPFLATSIVVVKNVKLQADFSHSDQQTIKTSISGSASAGFGCFSVRGSYRQDTTQVDIKATFDGTTLLIPNPQVIGHLGVLLPKSPSPDKTQKYWDPNAVFPEDMAVAEAKAIDDTRELDGKILELQRAYLKEVAKIDENAVTEKKKLLDDLLNKYGL